MKVSELKDFTTKTLRAKEVKDLRRLLQESRELSRELRFSVNANQLKDVKSLNRVKKVIARISTVLTEKH